MNPEPSTLTFSPKRAFAIAAHPDDIEFCMAGTLLLLKDAGYEIHYMNIANGSCGSVEHDAATVIRMRREEARRSAALAGAVFHESLVADLDIFYEKALLAKVASVMRAVAPEIVLTHALRDYMEDHMNAARLAVTAAFCRGMPNFPVDPPHAPVDQDVTVYHAQPHSNHDEYGRLVLPEFFVDVADMQERKSAMLAQHVSQKAWLDRSQGMDSYLITMRERDRDVGRLSGRFAAAEGWRTHNRPGFCADGADPLAAALGPARIARLAAERA